MNGSYYICSDCKTKLVKGQFPSISHRNNLELIDTSGYAELNLTELENCLIAKNIPFQKYVQLPKSRWTATKDHIVNIPIYDKDIVDTVKSFPRTFDEAGIIPVKLKRKLEYKNSHIQQFISIEKIFKALATLRKMGNKYYQFVETLETVSYTHLTLPTNREV